jgi:hypothetical protein
MRDLSGKPEKGAELAQKFSKKRVFGGPKTGEPMGLLPHGMEQGEEKRSGKGSPPSVENGKWTMGIGK